MSTQPNDGGPAFATATCGDWQIGMSIRDVFAKEAMPLAWELEKKFPCGKDNSPSYKGTAARAYLFADAMIAAREAKQ